MLNKHLTQLRLIAVRNKHSSELREHRSKGTLNMQHLDKFVEDMLSDIKRVREDENKELNHWQREIQNVKLRIEKIDKEIFSKID